MVVAAPWKHFGHTGAHGEPEAVLRARAGHQGGPEAARTAPGLPRLPARPDAAGGPLEHARGARQLISEFLAASSTFWPSSCVHVWLLLTAAARCWRDSGIARSDECWSSSGGSTLLAVAGLFCILEWTGGGRISFSSLL